MSLPSVDKDNTRTHEDRSTQTGADEDGRLVRWLVFSLRLFLVLFVAFARAVVIVADENIPDMLFDQAIPTKGSCDQPSRSQARRSNLGSLEALSAGTVSTSLPGYYIVFIGRQVGFTTSRYCTFDEALQAYAVAVQHGNVRRVRTAVQPSGHVEFIYDYMSFAAGIRNLDAPHVAPLPLTTANIPMDLLPLTPCDSQTRTYPREGTDGTTVSSVSSVSSATESSGLGVPVGCSTVNPLEGSADTVNLSAASTLATPPAHNLSTEPGNMTVLLLDSDKDSPDASIIVNNSIGSVHSAHSSDIYYTDKRYNIAFAAYIADEDSKVVNGEGNSVAAVQTE